MPTAVRVRLRPSASLALALVLLVASTAAPPGAGAQASVPSQFIDEAVASLPSPTAIAFTPDGRMLVTSQRGQVRVYKGGVLRPTPALDISAKACTDGERGLLGIAVDPAFTSNGSVYLFYTFNKHGGCLSDNRQLMPVNRVSRFTLGSSDVIDPSSERVLMDNIPSFHGNHNAGDLAFDANELLYASVGDGGCSLLDATKCAGANDISRRLDFPVGKVLRVKRDGSTPGTNPYVGATGSRNCTAPGGVPPGTGPCRETFVSGLRNPFRIDIAPGTTRLHINDVGQAAWEEIDLGAAGADYGWNVREGHCALGSTTNCGAAPAGMTNPIFDYSHADGCQSITGAATIPVGVWPVAYDGAYLFADYVCGKIFRLAPASGGGYTRQAFATGLGASSAVHMEFGTAGGIRGLYYTTYAGGGEVRRIRFTGVTNRAPTASLTVSPRYGPSPLTVTLNGSESSDPDGDALSYEWRFGDGTTARTTASSVTHTYASSGQYTASLVVRDARGLASAAASARIDVDNSPPNLTIASPTTTTRFKVGQAMTLSGSAVDPEDGALPASALSWTLILHHGSHTHPFLGPLPGTGIGFTAPAPEDLTAASNSYLEIRLTAADSSGLRQSISQRLNARKVTLSFSTSPSGLKLVLGGQTYATPVSLISWDNFRFGVAAPTQTDASGRSWRFSSWSDGGAASHNYVTPAAASTLSATFVRSP